MAVIIALEGLKPIVTAKYAIITVPLLIVMCIVARIIYNLYFHPLSSFPGPKLYAATDLPYVRSLISGNLSHKTLELHQKYGEVVRIAPNELSYNSAQAWKDIYGYRIGRPQMEKSRHFYDDIAGDAQNIIIAPNGDHSRFRRTLAHAFSEKAMREQEPLIKIYIDLLIQRLRETSGQSTDMVQWYNWTTFDVFGDLCFGEPFECLERASFHPWVSIIFDGIKLVCIMAAAARHPFVKNFTALLTPKSLLAKLEEHHRFADQKVAKRRAIQTDRSDFMSYILKHNDKSQMSDAEINSNAAILILAASETTATLMSGATYLLLQNPEVLKKLVKIIRETFAKEEDITIQSVGNVPYLLAVLDESLRMYPPVPAGLPRTVGPNGDTVCGKWIPGDTIVSVNQWSAFQSADNFTDPNSFIPERFMGDQRFASDNFQAFQPFSTGPRNCIGRNLAYAEMRLIVARILWNFDLELCGGMNQWNKQKMFTIWAKTPLMVNVRPKSNE